MKNYMINPYKISALLVLLFIGNTMWSQKKVLPLNLQEAYFNLDKTIGIQNTRIFTGVEYIENHRMINEKHKFFWLNEFVPMTVLYEDQPYFNVEAKYNIFDDALLVKLPSQRGATVFKLLPNRLDGFKLNSIYFKNIYEGESGLSGIFQVIYDGPNMQVLKKHKLSQQKISGRELVHYEFNPQSPDYYVKYRDDYYELSRKNLLELFPNHKAAVREQYRKYRKQQKDNRDGALVAMFQNLSELSNDIAQ
ncbi:hypothetical protein [Salinimicrobium sediminilitoris]|uniref:hypothetical protein n=1 Tax=Salinimicrobium sediminilitoris TaxID=2876715 RepID=UPI001E638241|nr:hypothetical protein [Salinimicrobium sediminilitoris]MCC8361384.1 hypothetical protein [Salinimicrobium sediminilitoris]